MTTAPVPATARVPSPVGPTNPHVSSTSDRSFAEVYSTVGEEKSSPRAPDRESRQTQPHEQPARAHDERQSDRSGPSEVGRSVPGDLLPPIALCWPILAAASAGREPAAATPAPSAVATAARAATPLPRGESAPVSVDAAYVRNVDLKTFLSAMPASGSDLELLMGMQSTGEKHASAASADPKGSISGEIDDGLDHIAAPTSRARNRAGSHKEDQGVTGLLDTLPGVQGPARQEPAHVQGRTAQTDKRTERGPEQPARDGAAPVQTDQPVPTQPSAGATDFANPVSKIADPLDATAAGAEEPNRPAHASRSEIPAHGQATPARESIKRLSLDILKETNTPVAVTMSNRAGRLSINVAAPDAATLKDIESNTQALVERLQARGVVVDDVSVQLAPTSSDTGGAATTASETGSQRRGERGARQPAQGAPRDDQHESGARGGSNPPGGRSGRRADLVV